MTKFQPARYSSLGSLFAYAICGVAAAASDRAIQLDWNHNWFWWVFLAVQVAIALGYCMSSLPKWGRWVDGAADTEYKLTLVVGVMFAIVAGNLAYYISFYEAGVKHLYCFLTALAGGFAGEKWLAPFLMRLLPTYAPDRAPNDKGG